MGFGRMWFVKMFGTAKNADFGPFSNQIWSHGVFKVFKVSTPTPTPGIPSLFSNFSPHAPESIFIMGDFNTDMSSSLPKDPMKSLIQHGHYKLPANEHNKLATTTEIYSPSPRRFKLSGQKLKVSTRNNDVEKGQIDAIFYSLSEHRSMVEITNATWLTATSMIPSLHDPSDHIPQLIDITEQTETSVLHNNVNEFIGLKK